MADEMESFFDCNKSDCIISYNEYTQLLNEIKVDLDALNNKTLKLEEIAKRMKAARPTTHLRGPI